jgi:2-methylcitrate dehydratase PrpD
MAEHGTLAERLAERIVALRYDALPADVVARAKDAVIDQFGVQLIGSTMAWNNTIYEVVKQAGGRAESTVVNHGTKLPAHEAAFVNATFGQGCELDDGLRDLDGNTAGHAGAMTVPVALALSERRRADGKTAIAAIVSGYETAFRLGQGMQGSHRRGFHNQSVIGPFAATAVASRMLGLDAVQTAHALAISGSQLSGVQEFDRSGGEAKRMHAGLATRAGIQSSLFALAGLTGPMTIFEGKRGVLRLYAATDDAGPLDTAIDRFGTAYGILRAGHKLYPVVSNLQSPIFQLEEIVKEHKVTADDIEWIDVWMATHSIEHGASISVPNDAMGAQVSLAFSLAIRLLKGSNDLSLYADPALWRDPDVARVCRTVRAHNDDTRFVGANDRGCHMTVTLRDGRRIDKHEEYPKGQPENALTHDEIEDKFRRLAGAVIPPRAVDEVLRIVNRLEAIDDMGGAIAPLLRSEPLART